MTVAPLLRASSSIAPRSGSEKVCNLWSSSIIIGLVRIQMLKFIVAERRQVVVSLDISYEIAILGLANS